MTDKFKSGCTFAEFDFPERSTLTITEIAERLRVSPKHILALIEEGKLTAINIGRESLSGRNYWRIPIESYREFILQNLS